MQLVIVESPAKAKAIGRYLGSSYSVLASLGHVRDLSAKEGSVSPDDDFSMEWEINDKSTKQVSEIVRTAKTADSIILATDPDREGEAIAWHVAEVLKTKKTLKAQSVKRVVFNAITKQSVLSAMDTPREIDLNLVNAYLARRALDYLVGFTLSPILWRKLPGAKSAGRVQSVVLRLICDREQAIETFVPQEYWTVVANLNTSADLNFDAHVIDFLGKPISRLTIGTREMAFEIRDILRGSSFTVSKVETKPHRRNPYPPFTTSTLQQAASSELGFSAHKTMQLAQKLYEGTGEHSTGGLITYMRTDSVEIIPEAISDIRRIIKSDFGAEFLTAKPRIYTTKAKNAQEAHEAIRPTDVAKRPSDIKSKLETDQARLYDLIWKRSVASQMESALLERTTLDIDAISDSGLCVLRTTGSVLKFEGFLALYPQSQNEAEDEKLRRLPTVAVGDKLSCSDVTADQSFTKPPSRYTESTIVKKMEEIGIGRPSTYASMVKLLCDRSYIHLEKRQLVPEIRGRIVTTFLEGFFNRYVEYDFTAQLEDELDKISDGALAWKDMLQNFWNDFLDNVEKTSKLQISDTISYVDEKLSNYLYAASDEETDPRACPSCGQRLSLKLGKFGSFIGCSSYPTCVYTRQIGTSQDSQKLMIQDEQVLGKCPTTGSDVTLKTGRFGPYVELGVEPKPKRSAIPKDWSPSNMTLEKALALLSLPRTIGVHPETEEDVTTSIGRFGPFIKHGSKYTSLHSSDEVFSLDLDQAVALIAQKGDKVSSRATTTLKELGDHPTLGGLVSVRSGRYGPYVTHKRVNVSVPKGTSPESLSLSDAVAMLDEGKLKTKMKKKTVTSRKAKKTG